jgi:molybdopterin converting factor small subunit
MKATILLFGIAKDVVGKPELKMTLKPGTNAKALKHTLHKDYPALPTFMLAVNARYASDELVIQDNDEIAIIPPTSGG